MSFRACPVQCSALELSIKTVQSQILNTEQRSLKLFSLPPWDDGKYILYADSFSRANTFETRNLLNFNSILIAEGCLPGMSKSVRNISSVTIKFKMMPVEFLLPTCYATFCKCSFCIMEYEGTWCHFFIFIFFCSSEDKFLVCSLVALEDHLLLKIRVS